MPIVDQYRQAPETLSLKAVQNNPSWTVYTLTDQSGWEVASFSGRHLSPSTVHSACLKISSALGLVIESEGSLGRGWRELCSYVVTHPEAKKKHVQGK